jgi:hypothetical protein
VTVADARPFISLNNEAPSFFLQNGANAYHSRGALMSKMNSLYRGMQSAAPHASSAWGQFCNLPFCKYPAIDALPSAAHGDKITKIAKIAGF